MGTALMQGDTCNLCGYQGSQFRYRGHRNPVLNRLQVIGAQRRKANCPRCGSSDRDRLSYAGITQRIAFGPQPRILHIAPEKQLSAALQSWLKVKHPDAQYLGIDKRTGLYRYPSWVQDGDIRNLPVPDAHFDLVIANHVLEHIQSLDQALKELKRCLKPGAYLLAQVPYSSLLEESSSSPQLNPIAKSLWQRKHHGQWDHEWLFGQDLKQRMAQAGFGAHWTLPKANSLRINALEPLMLYQV